MVPSGSSSSSFASSSLGYPPSYDHTYDTPNDSAWTPNDSTWTPSNHSALTANTSIAPAPTPLRPLDLGPPGYQATM